MRTRFLAQSTLGLALLFATPSLSHAYSLGEIRVTSMLGEAFYAEIPLQLREGESIKEFGISLASQEEYTVLELHRSAATVQLDVKLRQDSRGNRIVLKSESPIQEPFFNLLLKTTVGSGAHFRNFPVFLDIKKSQAPEVGREPLQRKPAVVQEVGPAGKNGRSRMQESQPVAAPVAAGGDYGPVRQGETLLQIARQMRGNYPGVSDGQLAAAIWRRNPQAFNRGNINSLRAGAVLSMPSSDEAHKFTLQETREVLAQQNRQRQEEVVVRPQPVAKTTAKTEKAPEKPVSPPVEDKRPSPALPAKETRRNEGKTAQTTEQPVAPASKPQDKAPTFEQKVTLQAGDEAASKPTTGDKGTVAPAPTEEGAESVSLQLSKSLSRLENLESKLNETSSALQNSEKARNKLQSSLTTLQQRLEQLEKEKAESEWSLEDLLLYAGGGLGVVVLGGMLALFSMRRKPKVQPVKAEAVSETSAAPAREEPSFNPMLAGVAAAGAGAAAAGLAMDEEETITSHSRTMDQRQDDEDDVIAPFNPSEYQEQEEEEQAPFASKPVTTSSEDLEQPFPNSDDLGNLAEDTGSSWQKALGVDEEAPADMGGADMDLDAMGGDLDLDQFASRTVAGLGGDEIASLDDQDGMMGDEGLDQGEDMGASAFESLLPFAPVSSSSGSRSGSGMEELDFSALDEFGEENAAANPLDADNEMDANSLFLPGATFDDDIHESEEEEGTLEARPISAGPGLMMEEGGLESLDLASLGLEDDAPPPPAKASVDLDLDSISLGEEFSLGNLDEGVDGKKADSLPSIDVPSFDVVEMDFPEEEAPKKSAPPPKAGEFELTTLDFDLEEDKK
ncbi:MAG: hypothetical protein G8345_15980 [Magnetococcales bacterium]|nr:hypothetical protein [Magnetococcales bacterium]NGZ28373.1 hypothetical protein [Magnetococcales bacterium]